MADEPISAASVSPPPPLSDHYHNARNKYALFSALLLAWDFLGIQIDIRSFFANVSINLPTPEKVPILLTGLVLYYAYRICIEWNQCDGTRRSYRSSQVDFAITHMLGFSSVVTYGMQQFLPPQFGQMVIDRAPTLSILSAVVLFLPLGRIVWHLVSKGFFKDRWCSRTPMARFLTFTLCFSVVQTFYIDYAVVSVMGSQILVKGNSTYAALFISSYVLSFLGYAFHELPFSRLPVLAFLKKTC